MANRFDELAKALAGNLSRREAVKRVGLGLAGALLASLGLARDVSAQGGSICEEFCKTFQEADPELFPFKNLGQCVSECQDARKSCADEGGVFCPVARPPRFRFNCCPAPAGICVPNPRLIGGLCQQAPGGVTATAARSRPRSPLSADSVSKHPVE